MEVEYYEHFCILIYAIFKDNIENHMFMLLIL